MSETIQQLIPYLDKIAIKLDMGAQKMWEIQMMQVKVFAITELMYWVLVAASFYGVHKSIAIFYVNDEKGYERSKRIELSCIIFGCVCASVGVVLLMIQLVDLRNLITAIFNPEFIALKNLLILVK